MTRTDTSTGARSALVASLGAVSGSERVVRAVEMAEEAKQIAIAGIRSRHPDLSAEEVAREWIRLLHGDEVAARLT